MSSELADTFTTLERLRFDEKSKQFSISDVFKAVTNMKSSATDKIFKRNIPSLFEKNALEFLLMVLEETYM